MPNLILLAAVASVRVGLYPLSLPEGQGQLQERLTAQLHEGAATLPGVTAFDLLPQSACAPDEGACLAEVARKSGVDQTLTAAIEQTSKGYRFHLRVFERARLRDELEDEVQGGPLDLAAALEHGVCRAMGAAPCLGELQLGASAEVAGQHLLVDGLDRGALPLPPLQLSVGRHQLKVADSELRVRVSYGRATRAHCEERQGAPALIDGNAALPEAVAVQARPLAPEVRARSRTALTLFSTGAALLVASAGAGLYSRVAASQLDSRYQKGVLTDGDASRYAAVHRTGTLALALAATGAGAIAASGLVLALSPSGASIFGSF
jgi:hypothetical protein